MTHTYNPITIGDRTFIPVSDITPSGAVEDTLTWANMVPGYDTWVEFKAREHWVDWMIGTAFTDNWTPVSTPDKTFSGVTKSDRTYNPVTVPSSTYKGVTK